MQEAKINLSLVTAYTQNTNDAVCFKGHVEQLEKHTTILPKAVIADSIFSTEENYEIVDQKKIENYLKFPSFHNEQKRTYRDNPFIKENFIYDTVSDTYGCPNNRMLSLKQTTIPIHKRTGYASTLKIYECESCSDCPFYSQCCKSEKEKNRILKGDEKLEAYKQNARQQK